MTYWMVWCMAGVGYLIGMAIVVMFFRIGNRKRGDQRWVRHFAMREMVSGHNKLLDRVSALGNRIAKLQRQVDCVECWGDHDWRFTDHPTTSSSLTCFNDFANPAQLFRSCKSDGFQLARLYYYKCKRCGCIRSWTWGELLQEDRGALVALGVK